MLRQSPIGVFDSGLGGLTVLKSLRERLPMENFIYLGDVARLPYGAKSQTVVEKYVRSCVQFLWERRVKWIVMACNTASALALKKIQPEFDMGISGVIAPGVRAALRNSPTKHILVLGTLGTVSSEAYLKEFQLQDSTAKVSQVACPLLVPLAEEGWFDRETTEVVIRHYLKEVQDKSFDTVLLGCTHYPLLEPSLQRVVGPDIRLVHSGKTLADELAKTLDAVKLTNLSDRPGTIECFSTDEVSRAWPMVQALFDRQIEFEKVDLP